MRPSRKLLFLAYYFPPVTTVGAVRTYNIAKWLSRLGWQVTVVTPSANIWQKTENRQEISAILAKEGIRCIRTEHRLRLLSELVSDPQGMTKIVSRTFRKGARIMDVEREAGWTEAAERACRSLERDDVDVILATGAPFSSFRLGQRISQALGRPYVLDYRDLWTTNPHAARKPRVATVEQEQDVLKGSSAVVAVSRSLAEVLSQRFEFAAPVHVVTNGYDPEEFEGIVPRAFGHFAIVYTGVFYPPKRVITPVMKALRLLRERNRVNDSEWAFHYYGPHDAHVRHEAEQEGILDRLVLEGSVPRREALAAVRGAGISVVISSVMDNAGLGSKGIVTGKVFEAIGLGTPVLAVAPNGSDLEDILNQAKGGRVFVGSDIAGMAAFLEESIRGSVRRENPEGKFIWPTLARRFDQLLSDVVGRPAEDVRAGAGLANG